MIHDSKLLLNLENILKKIYKKNIIFLSSNKNTYVTGQSFIIDGGFIVK